MPLHTGSTRARVISLTLSRLLRATGTARPTWLTAGVGLSSLAFGNVRATLHVRTGTAASESIV